MATAAEASGRPRMALWVLGVSLLALGVVMVPAPGPGVLVAIVGLLLCLVALVLTVMSRR